MAEKFGEFGELSVICQSKLVLINKNLLADLLIRQTFFHQMLKKSQLAKLSPRQTFPLYGSIFCLLGNSIPFKSAYQLCNAEKMIT